LNDDDDRRREQRAQERLPRGLHVEEPIVRLPARAKLASVLASADA
jgi:hypothetical protein